MGSSKERQHQPRPRRSVFVSSTSRDLIPHRHQASDELKRLGLFHGAMEQFGVQGSGNATSLFTTSCRGRELSGYFFGCERIGGIWSEMTLRQAAPRSVSRQSAVSR